MDKKILLVDDHPLFAKSVSFYLTRNSNVLAKWITRPLQVMDILSGDAFDLLIIDIDMPECNGLDLLKQVKTSKLNIPVLIVSMHREAKYIMGSMEFGAAGYILKTADPQDLLRGVESALLGKTYYCREVLSILAARFYKKEDIISIRQEEILKLTAKEYTIKEIAHQLNISPHTVITHRKNLMQKLSVKSQVGLAIFAVVNGYC